MSTIKRILDKGLYNLPIEDEVNEKANNKLKEEQLSFIRASQYFNHTMEEIQ